MVLDIDGFSVSILSRNAELPIVRNVCFKVAPGEVLGVVGESGCGKSLTNLAIMGLLPPGMAVHARRFQLCGHDMTSATKRDWRAMRGTKAAMIFQNPMSALNPSLTIGAQIGEAISRGQPSIDRTQRDERAAALLNEVGIASPRNRLRSYPHELSGGMAQRAMIAMALASGPELLIADEPTTGLDATIQAQILDLLMELRCANNMAMILVSHDIGVVRECADRIQVMYAGEIVETGPAAWIAAQPAHPYTQGLMLSRPGRSDCPPKTRLHAIPGVVPPIGKPFSGCGFAPRCHRAQELCHRDPAPMRPENTGDVLVKCHF